MEALLRRRDGVVEDGLDDEILPVDVRLRGILFFAAHELDKVRNPIGGDDALGNVDRSPERAAEIDIEDGVILIKRLLHDAVRHLRRTVSHHHGDRGIECLIFVTVAVLVDGERDGLRSRLGRIQFADHRVRLVQIEGRPDDAVAEVLHCLQLDGDVAGSHIGGQFKRAV